jgi:PAS domain S-box-containing protein
MKAAPVDGRRHRGLTLRRFLLLLVAAGAAYVAAIALVITARIAPIASALQHHSTQVLAAHDAIHTRIDVLGESIDRVHALIMASRHEREPDSSIRELVLPIRARLDSVAALRYAQSLEGAPASMRLDLASATQSEGELGIALLNAVAEVQLGRLDSALVRLRQADRRRQETAELLQSAQRSALADMVEREHRLGAAAAFAGHAVVWWLAIGAGLLPVLVLFVRTRVHAPLLELENALAGIAQGDLNVSIEARRDDEIGRLARHLNAMTAVLRLRADDERRRRENLAERLGHLLDESANEILVFASESGRMIQASRGARDQLGYGAEDFRKLTVLDLVPPSDAGAVNRLLDALRERRQTHLTIETRLRRQDGRSYPATVDVHLSFAEQPPVFVAVSRDITGQREAERLREALREFSLSRGPLLATGDLERVLEEITTVTSQALQAERASVWRLDGGILRCGDLYERSRARHVSGIEMAASGCPQYCGALASDRVLATDDARLDPCTRELAAGGFARHGIGSTLDAPVRLSGRLAGALRVEHVGQPRRWTPEEQSFVASMADFAAIAFEGAERRSLQAQLAESQRLESVGRLAGGVAHDFNNLLTAVLSHADLAQELLDPAHPVIADLQGIQHAALRAADLTRQLLTFARRQVVTPKVVDLNRLTQQMDKLLRRVIGTDVELVTILDPRLGATCVDPTQFEQVIVNLAVNARDAMPRGGKLTIETSNVELDREYARQHPEAAAGHYVMLAASDNGTGMDEATRARVFEPFYSTKDRSRGTGLGLSTVHGIVCQAGGHVAVVSELGRGTAFRVYLPLVHEQADVSALRSPGVPTPRGTETILLAEDEPQVRELLTRGLEALGYRLLVACNGAEGLEIARTYRGPIHLLVTDVVMPLVNGRDLADGLAAERPETGVLFMSGYAEETVVHRGVVDPGIAFLSKPFTAAELARHVREALDCVHAAPESNARATGPRSPTAQPERLTPAAV